METTQELVTVIKETGIEKTMAGTLQEKFNGFFEEAKKFEAEAKKIKITDVTQVEDMKKARELRLNIKNIRVNAEKVKSQLKEDIIRNGKAIDGVYNVIVALTKPVEQYLDDQEKYVIKIEEARKEKLEFERRTELSQYIDDVTYYDLKNMPEEGYQQILKSAKLAKEAELEAIKKAEEERVELEKKEKVLTTRRIELAPFTDFLNQEFSLDIDTTENEYQNALNSAKEIKQKYDDDQEKIRIENEKLRTEQIKKDKEAEAERIRLQKIADKAQEEADRLKEEANIKAEKEATEARIANEQAEADKNAKLQLEKEARYQNWLKDNGVTEETKPLFHIEKVDNEIRLYKVVSTFNIL